MATRWWLEVLKAGGAAGVRRGGSGGKDSGESWSQESKQRGFNGSSVFMALPQGKSTEEVKAERAFRDAEASKEV